MESQANFKLNESGFGSPARNGPTWLFKHTKYLDIAVASAGAGVSSTSLEPGLLRGGPT